MLSDIISVLTDLLILTALAVTILVMVIYTWRITKPLSPTEKEETSLKLEAQKISSFNGDLNQWPKWKSRTQCAFDGSGFEKVLSDGTYAERHPHMNKVVFSQLSVATVDGNAHHLIKKHEENRDGHRAWKELISWFDGDTIKNKTSEDIRMRLENLYLHSGIQASQYINKFLTAHSELEAIPGESFSKNHTVFLFLRNIQDHEYKPTVTYLCNTNATLDQCVTAIRKTERDIIQRNSNRRKLRQTIRRMNSERKRNRSTINESEEELVTEDESDHEPKKKKVRRFQGKIIPQENGFIKLDTKVWPTLEADQKKFVQRYNAKVKHKENLNELKVPNGITLRHKIRRVNDEKENEVREDLTNNQDEDDVTAESNPKRRRIDRGRKQIQFPLEEETSECP